MNIVFYLSSAVAIISTLLVITRLNAVHALLYLIVSLLAVALIFFTLGAPFLAALEVIIYAGAIMVLFVFVVMMLNLGTQAVAHESEWLNRKMWIGPVILAVILLAELAFVLTRDHNLSVGVSSVEPKQVGLALFGPYILGVELASMLLLAGLVGAFHLGQRHAPRRVSEESSPASPAAQGHRFPAEGEKV
jgi:NADH-quinone oxidoreductase subunit J